MDHRYLATDLATASPEAIVARLLMRAVQSARDARGAPVGAERTRQLRRSLDILAELRRALDFTRGGEIAFNLERLYEFASERLLRAGVSNAAQEFDEALGALMPIAEAFSALAHGSRERAAP
jgi:flagellar protein FliS